MRDYNRDDIVDHSKALWEELVDIPKGVYRMGWTAVIPTVPLLGLVGLVWWALAK